MARPQSDEAKPETLEARRTGTDAWQARAGKLSESLYPVHVSGGENCRSAGASGDSLETGAGRQDRVLINLHGGGFNSDSGSLTESVPIANLTRTKVIAVLYRLAPEHPFPAAVDDAVAVYKEVLKTYKPGRIAIYGTSAGAILTGEVAVQAEAAWAADAGRAGDLFRVWRLRPLWATRRRCMRWRDCPGILILRARLRSITSM